MLLSFVQGVVDLAQSYPLFSVIVLTVLPVTELRASIPYGILVLQLPWLLVLLVAYITNTLLGIVLYLVIDTVVDKLSALAPVGRWYGRYIAKKQAAIHPYVEKFGVFGLALFIGIPLPGSGVYTGALVANAIGMKQKHFTIATIGGVLMAAILVTIATFSGIGAFQWFVKSI